MSDTIVIGGSVAGLVSAFALAQQGREVTILERDQQPPPASVEQANGSWFRPTVPQSRQGHALTARGVGILASRAPELHSALLDAGALDLDAAAVKPPGLDDQDPRPGDEELRVLGVRRRTLDFVLRRAVLRHQRVTVRPGVTVRGIEASQRRVTGVHSATGQTFRAELIIDASGRKTGASGWLGEAGLATPARTAESCGSTYYTRYYRRLSPTLAGPRNTGFGVRAAGDYFTALLILGDNGTMSISLTVLPDDKPLQALRRETAFTAAVQAIALLAPWIAPDAAEPVSPVYAMAGMENTIRLPARSHPLPIGLYSVGDAACTTDPLFGRGLSLALAHAYELADVVAIYPDPDDKQARAVADAGRDLLVPWFADSVQNDRERVARWRETVHGIRTAAARSGALTYYDIAPAAMTDAYVWRRFTRTALTLGTPGALFADDEVRRRVAKVRPANPVSGPGREEFVRAVTDAGH
jgi:2-polyprenyl-6-methoxyphenol hydroxylase-like FAD-dependent oxidoreductase